MSDIDKSELAVHAAEDTVKAEKSKAAKSDKGDEKKSKKPSFLTRIPKKKAAIAATAVTVTVVAGVLDHLRAGARQGLVEAKRLLTHDLLAQFDSRGDEMARLSGLLFHSEVAQQRMAAALRR